MAETNKNVKKTNKKVETKQTFKEETKTAQTKKPETRRKIRKTIDPNELILVRSVTKGALIYRSRRNGMITRWGNYGDTTYMTFTEILDMRSANSRFLTAPFVVIDDEEVAKQLGLDKIYKNMINMDDIKGFFNKDLEYIENKLNIMPKGMLQLIADQAREMIKKDELYNIKLIKLLEDKLKIDLRILID